MFSNKIHRILAASILLLAIAALFSAAIWFPSQPEQKNIIPIKSTASIEQVTEKDTAHYTGLLVLVGVAQVLLFWVQLRLIRESLSDAKTAADAAKDSADATNRIVSTLQDNAHKQMRAHVFVDDASVWDESNFNPRIPIREKQACVSYSIKNSGYTPAYKLVHWGKMDVIEVGNESRLIIPPLDETNKLILPPGGKTTKTFWLGRPLTDIEISGINSFNIGIYIYGAIRYFDTFGNPHTSTYRLKYNGLYPPIGNGVFTFCDDGNDEN